MSLQSIDISFRYGPRFGIDGINVGAGRGEWLGIIGANGSGKTTLLRLLCGLLAPSSGRVVLDDEPLERYSANRRARHLAYVPQHYQPTFEFTVEQAVLHGRMPYSGTYGGFESDADVVAAEEAIAVMDIHSLRHEPVTRLSGGELQRVMIARSIAQSDHNILLDEPTSHLDIAHQQTVLDSIRARSRDRGTTVIATMHDLNLAAIYCDRLAAMVNGRLVALGTPAEVLTESLLAEVFGVRLDVEPNIYGDAPAVRYRYARQEVNNAA
ncbi:MAG: ABC transporter ATP-binding protein [bacterium]|nr:ABC transporter ATP-binding protein [Candidatus Kapabacteria bacterium]